MNDVIRHYDLLIDEGDDPVHDPPDLQAYMARWDGETFLDMLALDGTQSVLEIGVGTGRLARLIAPRCRCFTGVDLSPKTIARACENLDGYPNVTLLCGDFLTVPMQGSFDVICSSLTFLHIGDKESALRRIASLLAPGARAVISLDKARESILDYGTRRLRIYPDDPETIIALAARAGLQTVTVRETEVAHIIAAVKA